MNEHRWCLQGSRHASAGILHSKISFSFIHIPSLVPCCLQMGMQETALHAWKYKCNFNPLIISKTVMVGMWTSGRWTWTLGLLSYQWQPRWNPQGTTHFIRDSLCPEILVGYGNVCRRKHRTGWFPVTPLI